MCVMSFVRVCSGGRVSAMKVWHALAGESCRRGGGVRQWANEQPAGKRAHLGQAPAAARVEARDELCAGRLRYGARKAVEEVLPHRER